MSEKIETVRVINNRDRYYNGVRKGGILEVVKNETEKYLKAGFALLDNSLTQSIEVKENIVKVPRNKELQDILDHAGVQYDKKAKKEELQALIDAIPKIEDAKETDVEALKVQLITEAIVSEAELEGKTPEEILTIAKENHLID